MPLVQLNSQHRAVELHNVFTGPMGAKRDGKPLLCPPALSTRSHPTPQISPQNNSIFTRVSPNRVPLPLKAKKKRRRRRIPVPALCSCCTSHGGNGDTAAPVSRCSVYNALSYSCCMLTISQGSQYLFYDLPLTSLMTHIWFQ